LHDALPAHHDALTSRKAAHLAICLDADRYSIEGGDARFSEVSFVHRSLPEIDSNAVQTGTELLGTRVALPFFISSMTGGSAEAYGMNRDLATVAQELGIGVGMGSIRILFNKPDVFPHFHLKKIAPDVPVFANIGGVQLLSMNHDEIFSMLERLQVDGIAVHLNPGQELFQDRGDRDFSGITEVIRRFCGGSPVPVMVKETGFGINPAEALDLLAAGARYVNIAGSGGTNWITVESYRENSTAARNPPDAGNPPPASDSASASESVSAAGEFSSWGNPTALVQCALGRVRRGILASGGIRTGMDVVKSIALGAEAAGLALPFIRAVAAHGVDGGIAYGNELTDVLRAVMTLTGSRTVEDLRKAPLLIRETLSADARALRAALHLGANDSLHYSEGINDG